jgi:soluble lytic murein transglycosylase
MLQYAAPAAFFRRAALVPLILIVVFLTARSAPPVFAQAATDQLAAARRLEFNGEFASAEPQYQAAIQAGGETGQTTRLELARLYERWGRYSQALDTLGPLTEAECRLPAAACARASLQQGSVLQAMGRADESIAAYRRYIEAGGSAAAYARLESGKIQIFDGDAAGGLSTLAPLLGGQGPDNARRVALRTAAPVAEGLGGEGTSQALSYYRAHAALATTAAERVPSLSKAGDLARALGDTATAVQAYAEIVTRYPSFGEATAALDALAAMGRPAAALDAARVHYNRRNNETARTLFNSVLSSDAPAAQQAAALFYLGALAERRSEPSLAIENYTESFDTDPAGALADDALWWRAEINEDLDNDAAAQRDYSLIVERNTNFSRAAEAAFRNGFIAYEAGRIDDARTRWSASIQAGRNDVASTAAFWAGRAAAELGDSAAATAAYTEAARRDPNGYYGLRAGAVLAGVSQAPRNGPFTFSMAPHDWASAEQWLTGWAGAEDPSAWAAVEATEDWRATWELAQAGWDRTAMEAFEQILSRHADRPWVQYRAGRALLDAFPHAAFGAGFNIVNRASSAGAVPIAIQRMRYPAPWPDLVQRYADQRGVDPLLMYAMMRQESAFDPLAGSSAGAFGLTQFIAPTATEVARALDRDASLEDLRRPVLAIEFGAYYLSAQIREYGGSIYEGLAAYNGGGSNAARWRREAGGGSDVDRFQEAIDFSETESYIRLVLQNYAWYRHLYGAAEQPNILR